MSDELQVDDEIKRAFLEEARQLIADAEQAFLSLEKADQQGKVIESLFRIAHNLKGSAGAVGFTDLSKFTHQLETLLLKIKKGELAIQPVVIDVLLKCTDQVRNAIDALSGDFNAKVDFSAVSPQVEALLKGELGAAPPASTPHAAEPIAQAAAHEAPHEAPTLAPQMTIAPKIGAANEAKPAAAAPAGGAGSDDWTIRVNLGRIDHLINTMGEIVILQTVLNQHKEQVGSALLQKTIAQLEKVTREAQGLSMGLRMVPIKQTLMKMHRIVRDTSHVLGKEVELVTSGETAEIDKTVLDYIGDPLVHLIRNACDHGLESPEDREKAGKPRTGKILLKADHQGGQFVIEITDDGRGIDAAKLKAKAVEKGIIASADAIPDSEALKLIFHAGFSTKTEITDISGRGVGLDVVKTNIEKKLSGEVQLETQVGKGTTFRIILPLTLAIIDGMLLRAAGAEKYIVPTTQISETIRIRKDDVHHVSGVGQVLKLRGETMQLVRLDNLLARPKSDHLMTDSIALVVRKASRAIAFLVDDVVGQQQIVIKQLGRELQGLKGVTGSAILGDGRAALILDLREFVA